VDGKLFGSCAVHGDWIVTGVTAGSSLGGRDLPVLTAGANCTQIGGRELHTRRLIPARVRACRPYRAKNKGKVERPIRYQRQNFFYGRAFVSDADLNAQAERWLTSVANQRLHQTTRARPQERFEREKQPLLQPLVPRPYHSLILAADFRRGRTALVALRPSLPRARPPQPGVQFSRAEAVQLSTGIDTDLWNSQHGAWA